MSEFTRGVWFGSFSVGLISFFWMTWLISREHRDTIKVLNDHMDWLRKFASKKDSEGEEWKS